MIDLYSLTTIHSIAIIFLNSNLKSNYRISCQKIPTFWDLLDFLFRCEPYAWQLFNRSFFRKLVRTLIQNNILKRNLLHTSHITCQTVASFSSPLCSTSGIPFWPDFSYYLPYYGLTISSSSYPLLHFGLPSSYCYSYCVHYIFWEVF